VNDLVPVCPNCHAMLHTRRPAMTIAELRGMIDRNNSEADGPANGSQPFR
jgi:5-methylcytosine-specific restriction protein A